MRTPVTKEVLPWSPAPNSITSYVDDFCYSYPIIYLPQALPFWSFPVNSVFYPQSHTISAVHASSCYIGQMMGGGGGEDQRTMTCSAGLACTRPLGLKKHWTMTHATLLFCIGNKAGIGSVNLVVGSDLQWTLTHVPPGENKSTRPVLQKSKGPWKFHGNSHRKNSQGQKAVE